MHAYLNTILFLHSIFMISVVKMALKGEVGGHAKYHGIVFLNFCGNPGNFTMIVCYIFQYNWASTWYFGTTWTLKAQITTAADDTLCHIFLDF